jgi:hypothetical protein
LQLLRCCSTQVWRAIQFALDFRKMPENYKVNIPHPIKINTPWLIKVYNLSPSLAQFRPIRALLII